MAVTKFSDQIEQAARLKTKFVLAYYLLTIATSAVILFVHGRLALAADLLAALAYIAVTIRLYDQSRPKARISDSRKD